MVKWISLVTTDHSFGVRILAGAPFRKKKPALDRRGFFFAEIPVKKIRGWKILKIFAFLEVNFPSLFFSLIFRSGGGK